ncbi:outer membrane protein assembly factor BamD [Candidatus Pelagibacter sp. Uisw_113]|uniref:outer membrane protein assembly factor BamD n=1 Tax=Candidatus Pelagibacter sp. Uisw_113 TaxID=3230994 RepID=UPI0039E974C2
MKILIKYLFLFIIFLTIGCSSKGDKDISILVGTDLDQQVSEVYKEGLEAYEKEDFLLAAKKFNEAELLYPQSEWAAKSSLMAAYSYYTDGYYNDSIFQLEQFEKLYPTNPRISYAQYLLAMSYYSKIIDQKKDLKPLLESKNKFQFIINKYPNSEYALDSKFKLDLIEETLASKEMFVAKHYIKKEKWIPAINRLKFILDEYEKTIYVEEALLRLVEIYYKIGLINESKKYANLLGYNYQSSEWYEQSYKMFNKDYKYSYKKKKTKKKTRLEKLKSILD